MPACGSLSCRATLAAPRTERRFLAARYERPSSWRPDRNKAPGTSRSGPAQQVHFRHAGLVVGEHLIGVVQHADRIADESLGVEVGGGARLVEDVDLELDLIAVG